MVERRGATVNAALSLYRQRKWPIQRTIRDEGLAGGLLEENLALPEEVVDVVALLEGNEEDLAWSEAPLPSQVIPRKEDVRRIGEEAAEEHRGAPALYELDGLAQVEGDG